MVVNKNVGKFEKIFLKTEYRVLLFLAYFFSLLFLLLKGYNWRPVLFVHVIFAIVYAFFYFGIEFLKFFFAPIFIIIHPIQNYFLSKYLKKFKQNVPAEVVIILGQLDWFKFKAWFRPNFLKTEIRALVKYLEVKKQNFSFYPKTNIEDIEKIMSNRGIKEVYFFGHGDSHTFQLKTGEFLYYCEFNDSEKYRKEFVHQIHCGTSHGKSLIDYVVPKENRPKCFLFRKLIDSFDIVKEFKRRAKDYQKNKKSNPGSRN